MPSHYKLMRLLFNVEKAIQNTLTSSYTRNWDEDFISRTWLAHLRDNWSNISAVVPPQLPNVAWDAYKMTGANETKHGDIAFLVKVTFPNKQSVTGVAFLEAKRIYPKSQKYDALDWTQLKRQFANSTYHHLLLYDFQLQPILHSASGWGCWDEFPGQTSSIAVPTQHALTYGVKDRKLSSIGYRLSEQIVLRYFQGLDLDFTQSLVQKIREGVDGGVKYLAVAHVVLGENGDKELPQLEDVRPRPDSGYVLLAGSD